MDAAGIVSLGRALEVEQLGSLLGHLGRCSARRLEDLAAALPADACGRLAGATLQVECERSCDEEEATGGGDDDSGGVGGYIRRELA